ncbi:hypothetical protein MHU86_1521 [Fragilaria crotonensis]|nr:hypothetical protein MHU86_1521 [Fragilaria crotonensis]
MPIVNPYAKTKAPPSTAVAHHGSQTTQPQQSSSPPSGSSVVVTVTPSSGKAPPPAAARRKKMSFKAQLKQQLQDLKRKKKLEAERKLMEERLKEREAERRRIEIEQTRIREENERKRQEERKRKEEERQAEAEKRRKREEEKAMARKAAEEQRLLKEQNQLQIARQEFQNRQHLMVLHHHQLLQQQQQQQQHFMQYGFGPSNMYPTSVPSYSNFTPATQSPNPVSYPYGPPSSIPAMPLGSNMPIETQALSLSSQPMPIHQPQSDGQVAASPGNLPLHHPFPHHPLAFLHPPVVTPCQVNSSFSGAGMVNRWRMTTVPQVRRPPPPKILSANPLQPPSPFSDEYEILPYTIIIVKESGNDASFGVSVELKTRSVLVDRDVWESLMTTQSSKVPDTTLSLNSTVACPPAAMPPMAVVDSVPDTKNGPSSNEAQLCIANLDNTDSLAPRILQEAETQPPISGESVPESTVVQNDDGTQLCCGEHGEKQISQIVQPEVPLSLQDIEPVPDAKVGPDSNETPLCFENIDDADTLAPRIFQETETQPPISGESGPESTNVQNGDEKQLCLGEHGDQRTSSTQISEQEVPLQLHNVEPVAEPQAGPNGDETLPCSREGDDALEKNDIIETVTAPSQNDVDPAVPLGVVSDPAETSNDKMAKRKRRKRAFFHVMSVMDASKQNAKTQETDAEKMLQPGDLILEIKGVKTCGLPFFRACQLFASCNEPTCKAEADVKNEDDTKLIECTLLVARRKPPPTLKPATSTQPSPSIEQPVPVDAKVHVKTAPVSAPAGDFSTDELRGLAFLVVSVSGHPGRLLGYEPPTEVWKQCLMASSALVARDLSSIQRKLLDLQSSLDSNAAAAFEKFWKKEWESQHIDALKQKFMNLSQISRIRALPRQPRGCRCGKSDHAYVNSSKCLLYHGLRKLSGKTELDLVPRKATLDTSLRDLSAMETAFKDRFVKMKEDQDNEIAEAKFVDEMEKLQAQKLGRAVFAPSFTTMVLCAVASIGHKFKEPLEPVLEALDVNEDPVDPIDDCVDQDIDDLPLLALGKRPASDELGPLTKKTRNETDSASLGFHPTFLAQLLTFIGHTWGHVYREPTHNDFGWRWEVHHGQTSETHHKRENSKNPRTPGSLTFENVEFAVASTAFAKTDNKTQNQVPESPTAEDLIRLAYLVSPQKTGLLDELKALLEVSIIERTSENGAAILAEDWFSRVDPLILDDMDAKWSYGADPDNKYLIHPKVKRDLANYWIRGHDDDAWVLQEDLSEIIFLDDEWDEWRRSFEAEKAIFADNEDGIGKFGI